MVCAKVRFSPSENSRKKKVQNISKPLFAASPENCFFAKRKLPPSDLTKSINSIQQKSTNLS